MLKCSNCGNAIRIGEDEIHVGERDLFYHISCAPKDLLNDAVSEGNAVLARGVAYYIDKYLPNEVRAKTWPGKIKGLVTDRELGAYAGLFAKMLKAYREELSRRKRT